ncbi:MAG: Fur family transcriptional regulator [Ilumatobacteraceae bacterium]
MARDEIHAEVTARLRLSHQRYTPQRRAIVDVLAKVGHPLTIQDIRDLSDDLAQSSVYRNLVVLEEFGIVIKVVTNGDIGRYELAEDLTGHHHHLICSNCGVVRDVVVPQALEHDIDMVLATIARREGFSLDHHRLDVIGRCSKCR